MELTLLRNPGGREGRIGRGAINNNYFDRFAALKYGNGNFDSKMPPVCTTSAVVATALSNSANNSMLLRSLQQDNLLIRKKLNDLETRINSRFIEKRPTRQIEHFATVDISGAAAPVLSAPFVRPRLSKSAHFATDRQQGCYNNNNNSCRLSTAIPMSVQSSNRATIGSRQISDPRSATSIASTLSRGSSVDSLKNLDQVLDNLKSHRRSAHRREVYDAQAIAGGEQQPHERQRSRTSIGERQTLSVSRQLPLVERNESSASLQTHKENLILRSKSAPRPMTAGAARPARLSAAPLVVANKRENSSGCSSSSSSSKSCSGSNSRCRVGGAKAKTKEYHHKFYSSTWRIHSEFMQDDPSATAARREANRANTYFYNVGRKAPETFIFHPDWI